MYTSPERPIIIQNRHSQEAIAVSDRFLQRHAFPVRFSARATIKRDRVYGLSVEIAVRICGADYQGLDSVSAAENRLERGTFVESDSRVLDRHALLANSRDSCAHGAPCPSNRHTFPENSRDWITSQLRDR